MTGRKSDTQVSKENKSTAVAPIKDALDRFNAQYGILLEPGARLTHGYIARAMVLASMPHSEPKETYFERENGKYRLSMVADPKVGLPYGSIPRLLFAWMTTEAVRTKSRELKLGKSLSQFMRSLDIEPTGGQKGTIKALREQIRRLFATTISCTYSDEDHEAGLRMLLVDEYDLWWTPKDPGQYGLWESTITLSEKFFNEITRSPVIFYMEALKALRKSPMALDIYMWLTYKNSYSTKPVIISWESLQMQFGAGYPETSQGKANFKLKFREALKKVCIAYPDAKKLRVLRNGLEYIPGSPHVPKLS
jgi:hypothetical protein